MNYLIHICIFILTIKCSLNYEPYKHKGIYNLDSSNVESFINSNLMTLILFYNNNMEGESAESDLQLSIKEYIQKSIDNEILYNKGFNIKTSVYIAKYLVTNKEDITKFQLNKLPVFRLFSASEDIMYNENANKKRSMANLGLMDESEIVYFFQKVGSLAVKINKEDDLNFVLSNKPEYTMYLMYVGDIEENNSNTNDINNTNSDDHDIKTTNAYKKFLQIRSKFKDILYLTCTSEYCNKKFGKYSLVIFKNYNPNNNKAIIMKSSDFKPNITDNINEIKQWIESNSLGYVMSFNSLFVNSSLIIKKLALVIFRSEASPLRKEYNKILTKLAKAYPEISFHSSDIKGNEDIEKISKYFLINNRQELPVVYLIDMRSGDMDKYKFPDAMITNENNIIKDNIKISHKNLKEFIELFNSNSLEKEELSEPLSKALKVQEKFLKEKNIQDSKVTILVKDNYKDIVHNENKDVLVNFYTDWCEHCHHLMPFYENLAQYMSINQDLIIAKIDMSKNTIEGAKVTEYPTFKLYSKENKYDGEEYPGSLVYGEFGNFIKKYSKSKIEVPEIVYDKKNDL